MNKIAQFNRDSGQVFNEWTVKPVRPSDYEDWDRKQPNRSSTTRRTSGKKGPRSLVDTTVSLVGDNIGLIDVETIRDMPESLLWLVFDYLHSTYGKLSFHAWKLFAILLSDQHNATEKSKQRRARQGIYRKETPRLNGALTTFVKPMISAASDFSVRITICGGTFAVHDLLGLLDMSNLVVLNIEQPSHIDDAATFPRVSDRVVREWSSRPVAFPALRVLKIWGEDFTTSESLRYISKFRALSIYDVAGNAADWPRKKSCHPDWEVDKERWCLQLSCPTAIFQLGERRCGKFERSYRFKRIDHSAKASQVEAHEATPESTVTQKRAVAAESRFSSLRRKKLKGTPDVFGQFGI